MPDNNLQNLFPVSGQIPKEYDLTQPIEQKEYLVNGEMRQWKGKTQDVWSPIYIKTDKGFEQKKEGEKNNNIALSSKFVLKFL